MRTKGTKETQILKGITTLLLIPVMCLSKSRFDELKKVIVAILSVNSGKRFSTRAIHKTVYGKLVELEDLRRFLGMKLETLVDEVTLNNYGPTWLDVSTALTELVAEGIIEREEFETYWARKMVSGRIFYVKKRIDARELGLPFDIAKLRLSPFKTVESLVTQTKEDLINRFTGKNYRWKHSWNARLAYTLFRQTCIMNDLVDKNEVVGILDLIYNFDQLLELPRRQGNWHHHEPILPDVRAFADVIMEVLRCESLSEKEKTVAETIKDWVNRFALENGLQQNLESIVDEDNNLLVVLRGQNVEKIMLLFHLDTVKGYFAPKMTNGYVYGRGAVDNKCQGMVAIYSLMLLAANDIVPPFSVVVMGVSCEEISDKSKRGILKAIRRYNLSRENTPLVVVLEATNMNVATGQRQRWAGKMDVYGPGVHSAHIYQDEVDWIRKRAEGRIEVFSRYPDLRALVSKASVEIRAIPCSMPNGGIGKLGKTSITLSETFEDTTDNQTPSFGILSFDIRLGDENLRAEIAEKIKEILSNWLPNPFGFTWDQEKDNCTGTADFLDSDVGNHIKTLLERLKPFFDIFGARPTTYEFGVDGRYTVEAGIPTIGLAPGEELYAHRTFNRHGAENNEEMFERIRISDLFRATVVYFMLVQLCAYHKTYNGTVEIKPEACFLGNMNVHPSNTYIA